MAVLRMQSKGFWISLSLALVFYAAGVHLVRTAVALFLPLGLGVLSLANAWLGSRLLGWLIFTAAFVMWMTVLWAFAIRWRVDPDIQVWMFARALLLYGALSLAGLYQMRGKRHDPQ